MGYRYLRGRVDELVVEMEKEATELVDTLHTRTVGAEAA
jgi:biopolymer transport protein ExbB/TolQ